MCVECHDQGSVFRRVANLVCIQQRYRTGVEAAVHHTHSGGPADRACLLCLAQALLVITVSSRQCQVTLIRSKLLECGVQMLRQPLSDSVRNSAHKEAGEVVAESSTSSGYPLRSVVTRTVGRVSICVIMPAAM